MSPHVDAHDALALPVGSWLAQHTSPPAQFAELAHESARPLAQLPLSTQVSFPVGGVPPPPPPPAPPRSTQQSCFVSSHVDVPHVIDVLTVPVDDPPPEDPPVLPPLPLPLPLLPVPPLALPPDPDPEDPFPFAPFVVSVSGASFPPHAATMRTKAIEDRGETRLFFTRNA